MDKKFVIATHQLVYGAAHALRDHLIKRRNHELLFIFHPLVIQRTSGSILYKRGEEVSSKAISRKIKLGVIDYVIDFLLTLFWVIKQKGKHGIFIGVDPLNCLAGFILKSVGKVSKVVFYTIDFAPLRFKNRFLNFTFHKIETLCVKHANEVWDVSPRIEEGRRKFLGMSSYIHKRKIVPIGVWNDEIKKVSLRPVKKHQLLFVGHLLARQGVQLVLDAIPAIVKKIPDFSFLIVGGGDYEGELRKKVKDMRLDKYVKFKGWVTDRGELDKILRESACAVAPYKAKDGGMQNLTYYADPTKIKDYLSAGLPIILTNVPHNAKELERENCGIVVSYEKEEVAEAIIKLLSDEQLLNQYRKNALLYIRKFDWDTIFSNALRGLI